MVAPQHRSCTRVALKLHSATGDVLMQQPPHNVMLSNVHNSMVEATDHEDVLQILKRLVNRSGSIEAGPGLMLDMHDSLHCASQAVGFSLQLTRLSLHGHRALLQLLVVPVQASPIVRHT